MIIKSKNFKIFDSDALKKFHKRIFFSIVVFLCCYFLAIFRIADVMLLEINIKKPYNYSFIPERGKIYDRNGQTLADNINTFNLIVKKELIRDKEIFLQNLRKLVILDPNQIKEISQQFQNRRLKDITILEDISLDDLNMSAFILI